MALLLKHLILISSSLRNNGSIKTKGKQLYNSFKFISNKKSVVSMALQQPLPKNSHDQTPPLKSAKYKVGDEISGFTVSEVVPIPEFQLTAIKLVHKSTGGQYLHIDREDSNNAFCVMFRTTPTDSTGLPHILEHTTLCGSVKFPCRDPFFKMLNRSLATFMNAMTAPDHTMYPFSTQNPKDFENLMSVYLDAVFQPMLKESDFHQEGWRLEHTNPEDPSSPIIIKGVVYNEMKGVFANNNNLLQYALQQNMLPSHTYGVCTGGDPMVIPSLTHQDLKNFHKKYYSPLNAKYYSYGNFPLENHLKFLSEQYLQKSVLDVKDKPSTEVPHETKWKKPIRKHISCRRDPLVADKKKQSSIVISVLCCSITDVQEVFVLKVLSELLVSGPNSHFYKTLIEQEPGNVFSPATGFESDTRDTFFTVGLSNVSENDFEKIIKIYEDTIDDICKNGVDKKQLEAILHSIELKLKHQSSDFGLDLLFHVSAIWNHDGDVVNYLKIEKQLEELKKSVAEDPEYLQKKIKQYFKQNSHKLILTMSPDPDYDAEEKRKEEELLNEKVKRLTEEDKRKIFENGLTLLQEQKSMDKSCLPTLKISDLKKDVERIQMDEKKIDGVSVYVIPQPTNGITYFRGLLTLGDLSSELKPFLPLFTSVCTQMGTKKRDYKEFDRLATLKTGGLETLLHYKNDIKKFDAIEESLCISSYCLNRNLDAMFDLWLEIFRECTLEDVKRMETLLKAHASRLVNGVTSLGHSYAMLASGSLVSGASMIKEQNSGLTYVNFVKNAAQDSIEKILPKMVRIRDQLLNRNRIRCAVNVPNGTQSEVVEQVAKFIQNTPGEFKESNALKEVSLPNATTKGVFHVLPIPVSYTGKAITTTPFEHEDHAAMEVLARLMTMKYLHPEIREKGGAYGGGALQSNSGILHFYSYRDPNPANSHSVYDNSFSWLKQGDFTQEDVDEAKLGLFQSIDSPTPPGHKGMTWFMRGITDESLQRYRLRVMKVTKDMILEAGERYLGEKNTKPVGRAVIGPENKTILDFSHHNWEVRTHD